MNRIKMRFANRFILAIIVLSWFLTVMILLVGCGDDNEINWSWNNDADNSMAALEGECAALSETDVLEGAIKEEDKEYTLKDYIDAVKSGGLKDGELHSQLLYKIIPEQFFVNKCRYLHKGTAYSFYIQTKYIAEKSLYASEVVIVPHRMEVIDRIGEAVFDISAFSNGYYTYTSESEGSKTLCNKFKTSKYYLQGVQLYCGLENVGSLNYGDEGYSKTEDKGNVIARLRVKNSGIKEYDKSGSFKSLSKLVHLAMLSYVPEYSDYRVLYKGQKSFGEWQKSIKDYVPSDKISVMYGDGGTDALIAGGAKYYQMMGDRPYYQRFATVMCDNPNLLVSGMSCSMLLSPGNVWGDERLFFAADYNLLVHTQSEKDYIILSDGSTKAYKSEYSESAQFSCRREQVTVNPYQ